MTTSGQRAYIKAITFYKSTMQTRSFGRSQWVIHLCKMSSMCWRNNHSLYLDIVPVRLTALTCIVLDWVERRWEIVQKACIIHLVSSSNPSRKNLQSQSNVKAKKDATKYLHWRGKGIYSILPRIWSKYLKTWDTRVSMRINNQVYPITLVISFVIFVSSSDFLCDLCF